MADRCFDLGKALIMGEYISNHRNTATCAAVKEAWKKRNVQTTPSAPATSKPRIVMAYIDRSGLSADQLVAEYDWDHFISTECPTANQLA